MYKIHLLPRGYLICNEVIYMEDGWYLGGIIHSPQPYFVDSEIFLPLRSGVIPQVKEIQLLSPLQELLWKIYIWYSRI